MNCKHIFRPVLICMVLALFAVPGVSWAAPESRTGSVREQGPSKRTGPLTAEEKKTIEYQLRAARELRAREHWDAAVLACQEVLKLDPANAEAQELLCKICVKMGNWAYTINTLRNLMRQYPANPYYIRTLVQVCEAYDMPLQEREALERLALLEPRNVALYERLAVIYHRLDMPWDVARAWERAYKVAPQDPKVIRKLADSYDATNQSQQRAKLMEKLIALQPGNEENKCILARIYAETDQPDKAMAMYRGLLATHPNDADYERQIRALHYDMGNMYYDHGMYAKALEWYQKAQAQQLEDDRLGPQMRKARKLLHPSLAPIWEGGRTGVNKYDFTDVTVGVPLRDIDIVLKARQSRRYVRDVTSGAAAGTDLTRLMAEYHFWKDWRVAGMIGTSTHGAFGGAVAQLQEKNFEASFGYMHDFVFETPLAISSALRYDQLYGEANYSFGNRFNVGLELYGYNFSNGNNAFLHNEIFGYSVLKKDEVYNLTMRYIRSDFHNKFNENPLLRFGPVFYGTNNFAAIWEHRPGKSVLYQLEYVKSYDQNGKAYNSYRGRFDVELGLGTNLFAQFEKGAAAQGIIQPGTFNSNNDYRTLVGAQVTF